MTEEEIRPIAENYVEEYCHCSDGEYTDGNLVCAGIGTALIVSWQLEKRIAELKAICDDLSNKFDFQVKEVIKLEKEIEYAKTIIQDLLDNSDEYARQRAMDFLEEE